MTKVIPIEFKGSVELPKSVMSIYENMPEEAKKEFNRSLAFHIMSTLDAGDGLKFYGQVSVKELNK